MIIINILNKLLAIIDIDYGYMFYLKEKQNWIFENNFKVSLLSATSKMPDDFHNKREKLLEINNGYFPKVYKYNIFNIEQAKIFNKNNLITARKGNKRIKNMNKEKFSELLMPLFRDYSKSFLPVNAGQIIAFKKICKQKNIPDSLMEQLINFMS